MRWCSLGRAVRDPALAAKKVRTELVNPAWRRVSFPVRHRWLGSPTLWAFPTIPTIPRVMLLQVCDALGLRLTLECPETAAAHVRIPGAAAAPMPAINGRRIINANGQNVRKRHVDAVFQQVAGYGLCLDPRTHDGLMVRKSDWNGRHDGEVVQGPIVDVAEDVHYQRLVDNSCGADAVEDLRVAVCGRQIALAYIKRRPLADRFAGMDTSSMTTAAEVFSREEMDLILRFAEAMGADFAEIDVLRDCQDGRIYAIDVNINAHGPPAKLRRSEKRRAVRTIAASFREAFVDA